MNTRNFGLVVLTLAVAAGAACGKKGAHVKDGALERTMDQQALGKKYIESIGIGAADTSMTNQTQRMATSRNAAIAAAQHELLSLIKGTRLQGGITIERAIETDSKIQTSLDEVLRGAEIYKTEWTKDDGAVISMRVARQNLEKMMGVKLE